MPRSISRVIKESSALALVLSLSLSLARAGSLSLASLARDHCWHLSHEREPVSRRWRLQRAAASARHWRGAPLAKHLCVCARVCVRARERERARASESAGTRERVGASERRASVRPLPAAPQHFDPGTSCGKASSSVHADPPRRPTTCAAALTDGRLASCRTVPPHFARSRSPPAGGGRNALV